MRIEISPEGIVDGEKLNVFDPKIAKNLSQVEVDAPYLNGIKVAYYKSKETNDLKKEDASSLQNIFNEKSENLSNFLKTKEMQNKETFKHTDRYLVEKGFKDGYALGNLPEIAEHLIKIDTKSAYIDGIRKGFDQFKEDISKDKNDLQLHPPGMRAVSRAIHNDKPYPNLAERDQNNRDSSVSSNWKDKGRLEKAFKKEAAKQDQEKNMDEQQGNKDNQIRSKFFDPDRLNKAFGDDRPEKTHQEKQKDNEPER